jgi:hypothetical protein
MAGATAFVDDARRGKSAGVRGRTGVIVELCEVMAVCFEAAAIGIRPHSFAELPPLS